VREILNSTFAFLQKKEADKQRADAVASRNEAEDKKAQAVAAKNEADAQKAVAVSEKEHAEDTIARSDFLEAEALIKAGDKNAAMAYLARSLRANKKGNPAAPLAFDLLLRQPVLRAVLEGSTDTVNCAAFSPDGCRVVSASKDGKMRVWDARTGQTLVSFGGDKGFGNSYSQAAFSPDGSQVLTSWNNFAFVGYTDQPSIWDAKTGKLVAGLAKDFIGSYRDYATYSPDGSKVVACLDNFARVFDAKTGAPLTPPLPDVDAASRDNYSVRNATFSPDGKAVAVAFNNSKSENGRCCAQIFDTQTGRPITPPLLHDGEVFSLAFSADSSRLFTYDYQQELRVWNSTNGALISATKPIIMPFTARSAVFSPDRTSILIATSEISTQVLNTTTGQATTVPLQHAAAINYGDYSPDGTEMVTASDDGTARVWELKDQPSAVLRHDAAVSFATFSPDGDRILTICDKTIYIWDDVTNWLQPPAYTVKYGETAAYSANGKLVAEIYRENCAQVRDAQTGKPVTPLLQHQDSVSSVKFSPDSTRVVTASHDNTARVWDARTGKPVTPPMVSTLWVDYATFSPDGTRVVTTSTQSRVWDAETGEPVTPWFPPTGYMPMGHASFSPDGTRVATGGGDNMAMVWDAKTGQPVAGPFKHQDRICTVKFGPDGKRLLTASEDRTARVWDIVTGQPLTPPMEHQSAVYYANFSPDGTLVVTGSRDHSARIWEASTGLPLTLPLSHSSYVYKAAIADDNQQVGTLSGVDGPGVHNVQIWDLAPNSAPPDWLSDLLEAASLRTSSGTIGAELKRLKSDPKAEESFTLDLFRLLGDEERFDWRLDDLWPDNIPGLAG
jgi:WD40 repeat protein